MTHPNKQLLILQCDSGHQNGDLIACATHIITDEHAQATEEMNKTETNDQGEPSTTQTQPQIKDVLFLIQLPRVAGGCFVGFQVETCRYSSSNI